VTIHELGHAFEVLGDLRLPTFWLGEIFANLALHAFVATKLPESSTHWRCFPSWERRVGVWVLGCAPLASARWKISKPTTREVMTR